MKLFPTLEEAKKLAEGHRRVPVATTLYADVRTPIEVLKALRAVSRHCYILESLEDSSRWGRYTFLGYDPTLEITCRAGRVTLREGERRTEKETGAPFDVLREVLRANASPRVEGLPPFTGGLVGYFSYETIQYAQPSLRLDAKDEENFQDFDLMLFDKVIAFDNLKQRIYLIVNLHTEGLEESYKAAQETLAEMARLVTQGEAKPRKPLKLKGEFRPLFGKEEFCAKVERAKHYIKEGDIFQVVLSNRLAAEAEGSLMDTYRVLRTTNPSPYMFFFSSEDVEIAGASPETLVKLTGDTLYTFPLAGTRPRGATRQQDEALEAELLADPKECAEHNMLVDLGRNDLGRVSTFGSVEVERYMTVERFSHVMHIGSTVRGSIRPECDALDAIGAVLPAGTLSGAPKIRACEIINELEGERRGIYGGAIGYIDLAGNMDTCIAIRLAFKKNGKVFVRSGGGIVADSVPETEHTESLNKARAVLNALAEAEGGLAE